MMDTDTEQKADLSEKCWYDPAAGKYYHENSLGRWVPKPATPFMRWLKSQGLSSSLSKKELGSGVVLSEIDALMTHIETERLLDYVGGIAGWKTGPARYNNDQLLITHELDLLSPEPPKGDLPKGWDKEAIGCPVMGAYLEGIFRGNDVDPETGEFIPVNQLDRVLTYMWHFLKSLYAGTYSNGLAMGIAGEPGAGKTLFADLLQYMAGRVVARPYRYMTGQDAFNQEMLEAAVLLVDDENSDTSIKSRMHFGGEIKQIVATHGVRIRAMQKKAVVLAPIQRLLILVNLEPERLQVLPPLDNDIIDKFLILKGYSKPMPMPSETPEEKKVFWDTMAAEVPKFLWWILNVFDPPKSELGRFGAKAWTHPEISEALGMLNAERKTFDQIEQCLATCKKDWTTAEDFEVIPKRLRDKALEMNRAADGIAFVGTCEELMRWMRSDGENAPLSMLERQSVRKDSVYLGRDLTALSRQYPHRFMAARTRTKRFWVITAEPKPQNVTV